MASALKANGQFTVFAPTDAAFAAAGAQSKSLLARQMSYLNVLGKYDAVALLRVINEAGGEAKLRTAQGGVLVARMNGPTNIQVINEKGKTANIAIYDVRDKNGIVHVVYHLIEPAGPARQVALSGRWRRKPAPFQQSFYMRIAAAKGAIGGGIVARASRRIDELVQPTRCGGIEGVKGFLESLEAIGIQNLRPHIGIIARRIAVAAEDVREM